MRDTGFPGAVLRERREALGYGLRDAHAAVHIPIEYIQALEEGRLDALPGPTYALGFLNSYCTFLELDPEPFADRYRALAHRSRPDRERKAARPSAPVEAPGWWGEIATWATICGILLLGWLAYNALVSPIAEDPDARVEAGTIELAPPDFEGEL